MTTVVALGSYFIGAEGSGPGGWPIFASGVGVGVLAILVAIGIALWQRVLQLRDRSAQREQERVRRQEQAAQEAKVTRREKWRTDYEDIRKLLDSGEELAYWVRHDGPYTADGFAARDVATFRMNCERLSERGVEGLRDPLRQLARTAEELTGNAVPDESTLKAAFTQSQMPDNMRLNHVLRLAVNQDRAARDLANQTKSALRVLRDEWGN